jgi:hypothetical protein
MKTTAAIERYPAMGSSSWQVGRLGGVSCGNNGSNGVVALAIAQSGSEQHNKSMCRAGRGQAGCKEHNKRGQWMIWGKRMADNTAGGGDQAVVAWAAMATAVVVAVAVNWLIMCWQCQVTCDQGRKK